MSSQLVSIVPGAPLTDETFPFNRDAFIEIRTYQEKLVSCFYFWKFNSRTLIIFQRFRIFVVAGDLYRLPLWLLETNVLNHLQPVQALVGVGDVVGGTVIYTHFFSVILNLIHGVYSLRQ